MSDRRPAAAQTDWRTLAQVGEAMVERRRSLFFGYAAPIASETDAQRILGERRSARPDCGHHVYAWRCGRASDLFLQRMSDDGEPSGTGAMPILQRIEGRSIEDLIVVVSRVWGGTLLGTGGLARAYGDAAAAAIDAAGIVTMIWGRRHRITVDYDLYGSLEHYLMEQQIAILERDFTATVAIEIELPVVSAEAVLTAIRDRTAARATVEAGRADWIAVPGEAGEAGAMLE